MKCPFCNQEHPDKTKFCPETGNKLEMTSLTCSSCGFYGIPIGSKFCPNCGNPISSGNAVRSIAPVYTLDAYLNEVYHEEVDPFIREYIDNLLGRGLLSVIKNEDGFLTYALNLPFAKFKDFLDSCIEEARDKHEIVDGQLIEGSSVLNHIKRYADRENGGLNLSNLFHDFTLSNETTNAFAIPEWVYCIISKVFYRKGLDFFLFFDDDVVIFDKDRTDENLGALAIRRNFNIEESIDGFFGKICPITDGKGMKGLCYRGNPLLPNEITLICPPIFKEISKPKENMVRVKDENDLYGYIDLEGNHFIEPKFEYSEFLIVDVR